MTGITPIIRTTFTIPTPQGKDIYSPLQKAIGKFKLAGTINKDGFELSTYNNKAANNVTDILNDLKAKFVINSFNE